ncbi:hypothetical protein ACFO4L_11415 [Bacillus daqingensis]|uniref:Uncharacterized protein n=1 Tax=Bacillus daqingensis TaxID=872396 RepID=A0ABV9NUY3_9BACI
MSVHMNVYLKNENAAESLRTKLLRYHVTDLYIDELPDGAELRTPFIATGSIGGTPGNVQVFTSLRNIRKDRSVSRRDYPHYLISFRVPEEYKEQVLKTIKQADGYIEESVAQ